ncbi:hypothetical protein H0I86_14505 [Pseudomonas chlororaphis subsp. aurantiaca]|nr:hypothetical protein H0I86_14505 [Pseudomonas chlororaphis subsp. aurantiaca]
MASADVSRPGACVQYAGLLYVESYANLVEGVDLCWLVGLLVSCPLHYCLATRSREEWVKAARLGFVD